MTIISALYFLTTSGRSSIVPTTGTPIRLTPIFVGSSSTITVGSMLKSGVDFTCAQKAAAALPAPTITTLRGGSWSLVVERILSRPTLTAIRRPPARNMCTPHSMSGTLRGMPSKSVLNASSKAMNMTLDTVVAFATPNRSGTETYRHRPVWALKYTSATTRRPMSTGTHAQYDGYKILPSSRSSLSSNATYSEMSGRSAWRTMLKSRRRRLGICGIAR